MRVKNAGIANLQTAVFLIACLVGIGRSPALAGVAECGSHGESNQAWMACEKGYLDLEERRLHDAEQKLLSLLPPASRADFQAEETAWRAYEAKACTFYFNGDWGRDGQVVQGPLCKIDVVTARTKVLGSLEHGLSHYEQAP